MQFVRSRRHIKLSGERNPNLYPHALQFYKLPPLETITLEEFEAMALERLQVLRIVERATVKHFKNYRDLREAVFTDLRKQNLSSYCKITVDENKIDDRIFDDRRKDHISHFILRLAYCRSENLRRWFVTQEVDLFRIRFMSETGSNRRLLMELNDLDYKPIDKEEKKSIIAKLASCAFNNSSSQVALTDYYKVPFIEVLDLVRSRKIFLRDGYAYISESNLVSIVVTAFRSHLSHALAITSRALPQLEEDERLLSMLSTLHQRYVGDNYNDKAYKSSGEISPDMLDSISKTSYPLCMSTLHESLRKNHHLKYGGRLVYGLFLKGIGMTLEDSIRFWRNEFTKIMDVDKFDKQYSYNIRHNYGKEGKRANYTPHNCMKIISNAPGPGDAHGCPFKHCDTSTLKQKLQSLHINSSGITDIMNFVEKGHYQLACTRYFEATHNEATVNQAISHPNQYFEESQKQRKGTTKSTERNVREVPSTKVLLYNSTEGSSQNSTQIDLTDSALLEDIEDFLINSQE